MKVAIMTDSNSGLSAVEQQPEGLFVMPMPVIIDGKEYYEEKSISQEDFYDALNGGGKVSTSQPSPGDVMQHWDDILAQGYDQIVYIPMSSGLSQSCNTAKALAEDYEGKVWVADNHRVSVTQRMSVLKAKEKADAGMSAEQIAAELEKEAYDSVIYLAVNTLEFLRKGGRVTAAAAAIGSVLKIKPVLIIEGGKLDAFAKARGMKKAKNILFDSVRNDIEKRFGNDETKVQIGVAGSGLSKEEADELLATAKQLFPNTEVFYNPLPFSVSVHTGPGAIGIGVSL